MNQQNHTTESVTVTKDTMLICAEERCGSRFLARIGFNRPVNLRTATRQDVLKNATCDDCARRLGLKHKLLTTLDMLDVGQRRAQDARSYAKWAENGSRERTHEALIEELKQYGEELAFAPIFSTAPGVLMPEFRENNRGVRCGLQQGCCRHDHTVDKFVVVGLEVFGICRTAAYAFRQTANALRDRGHGEEARRLWTYDSLDKARQVVERKTRDRAPARRRIGTHS